ncbi:phage late control D family protein [Pseudomonas aeruginosa]|uniref:contractile injection system protein, VgrG/Pvc8 family n=2 Tax=Bacteria TaxID=2 RepID=UPI00053DB59D|nr:MULTISPECIES: contractile injection system protein, VgrG/Pvc8 family [Pseudomonas]EKV4055992.1 phage late control D family protein [Pseudomonas aeruginosa]ELM1746581.1 phage late control D family protein [Pseudomonas aeruginosa]MBV6203218.1 phage late control D family protein [Pseudomonas aeruginosa]NQB40270.1 phage late control D family protein [Pseudomonas aeruginosa]HBO5920150.1 phage late control D family protein [Pseudomonas aeruginosa]
MAIGYTPAVEIYGANAALINARLVDWEHVDAAGIESDTLKLTVNIEGLEGLPSVDGKIGLRVGYKETGLVDKGEFVVTRTTPQLFPALLLIVATAAPFKVKDETGFKARRSASYAMTTLGQIFRQLTTKHGFSPRVAAELDAIPIVHVDQSNETDMGFLTRLARRYDAVTKPVNDLYVLARRGQVKSLSGKPLPPVTLSVTKDNRPGDRAFIAASIDQDSRVRFKGCKTTWWDGSAGKECVVEVGEAPFKTVRQRYQDEAEAKAAAEGEHRKTKREAAKLRIDCPGNPAFGAEGLLELDDSWPSFMRGTWSIDKVTASGSRQQSYRCTLEASYPDGRQE